MAEVGNQEIEEFFDEDGEDLMDAVEDVLEEEDEESFEEEEEKDLPVETDNKKVALNGLGFDFSALSGQGVVVGDVGLTISRFPVERAKFTKSEKALISILSEQVIVVKTHYTEDIGNFICFGGECCERDLARVRYVFPILRYDTNKRGAPVSKEVNCQALSVGQDVYESLLDIQNLKGSLSNFDLLVTCTDEGYQKISVQEAGEARYKKSPAMVKEINEFWAKNSKDILKGVARNITPAEYKKLTAEEGTASEDVDFDSVFS